MATVDSRAIVDALIAGNGQTADEAPDNPRVVKIVEYTTVEGNVVWGLVFENETRIRDTYGNSFGDRYDHQSQYVRQPHIIWQRETVCATCRGSGMVAYWDGGALAGEMCPDCDQLVRKACDRYRRPVGVMGGPCLTCGRSQPEHREKASW